MKKSTFSKELYEGIIFINKLEYLEKKNGKKQEYTEKSVYSENKYYKEAGKYRE